MKIRTAFISNSSSCSFCIGKNFMTEEQIKKFGDFCKNILYYEDSRIGEGSYYFSGIIEQDDWDIVKDKLVDLGVDAKYIG